MAASPDYSAMGYDQFLDALEQEQTKKRRGGFGLPEGYEGPFTGKAGFDPVSEEDKEAQASEVELGLPHRYNLPLEDQISLVPQEVLERELQAAAADYTAVYVIASTIDSRRAGERKLHGNISELVDQAHRLGQLLVLLRREERLRGQGTPEGS